MRIDPTLATPKLKSTFPVHFVVENAIDPPEHAIEKHAGEKIEYKISRRS